MLDKMSGEIDEAQSDNYEFARRESERGIEAESAREGEAKQAVAAEAKQAVAPAAPPPPSPPAPIPTPHLRVVHLAPDDPQGTTTHDEQAPRLVLTNASLDAALAAHAPHALPRVNAAPEDGRHDYNAALELMNLGGYAAAEDALTRFLIRWPASPNAADALYARAQCNLAQGDFANAARSLEALLKRFPSSRRAGDARFALDQSKRHLDDASLPAPQPYSRSGAPRAAAWPAPPPPRPADPRSASGGNDDDNAHDALPDDDEHIVPADEDNEHLVGGYEK